MKAHLEFVGLPETKQIVVVLTPESHGDNAALSSLAKFKDRPSVVSLCEFGYMDPEVKFMVQPKPDHD